MASMPRHSTVPDTSIPPALSAPNWIVVLVSSLGPLYNLSLMATVFSANRPIFKKHGSPILRLPLPARQRPSVRRVSHYALSANACVHGFSLVRHMLQILISPPFDIRLVPDSRRMELGLD